MLTLDNFMQKSEMSVVELLCQQHPEQSLAWAQISK